MATEQDKEIQDAVGVILRHLNGRNRRAVADVIVETVSGDHRTIQQNFWSAILQAQMEYSVSPFDARNEASVQLANKVKDLAIANNWDLGLPRI